MATYSSVTSLSSLDEWTEQPTHLQRTQEINDLGLSEDLFLLAWAGVLEGFTGSQNVIFWLDEQPIQVSRSSRTFERVADDLVRDGGIKGTAVFFNKTFQTRFNCRHTCSDELNTSHEWSIILEYDSVNDHATLSSTIAVSQKTLEEIGTRLKREARKLQGDSLAEHNQSSSQDLLSDLSILNPAPRLSSGPQFLHQLIDFKSHRRSPAIQYLKSDDTVETLSYGELDKLSNQLAVRIVAMSERVKTPNIGIIPVLIPQSTDLYIALIAILKAGGAFCPLNLDAPAERIKLIIDDIQATVFITTKHMQPQLEVTSDIPQFLYVDDLQNDEEVQMGSLLESIYHGELAYVMYTSGSTGTPKGVPISHKAATQALLAHREHIPTFKKFLQFAAPTFDVSVFEIFFPLMRGSTLACCDRALLLGDLAGMLNRLDVDSAELTPTVAGTLLKSRGAVPSLKLLLTIGEMLTKPIIKEFGCYGEDEGILYGMYGPTEATIHCTIVPRFDNQLRVGIIGMPFSTVSAFILSLPDTNDYRASDPEILPIGHIGELAIGGHQLADGYLNRPEQTEAAFVNLAGYGRVYRTGDKARLNFDGQIECLGRISTGQVKLRGQRVELGEIEQVAYRLDAVHSAIACVLEGSLVLFCVASKDGLTINDIQDNCKRWLPGYMRPGEIVLLNEVPKLASGKIDRRSVEENFLGRRLLRNQTTNDFQSEGERGIAQVLEKELGTPITRLQNLSNAGLDSLRAIKIVSELRQQNFTISVLDLLDANNIAEVAMNAETALNAHEVSHSSDTVQSLKTRIEELCQELMTNPDIEAVLPCSNLQLGMLSETARSASSNFNSIKINFSRELSFVDLRTAFQKVASINDVLRSGFTLVDIQGHPFARFVNKCLHDFHFLSAIPAESRVESILSSMSISEPLRIFIDDNEGRALVLIHHALYDLWSWDIVMHDLNAILRGDVLSPRPQYDNVTSFSISVPESVQWREAEEYWRSHLEKAPLTFFPSLHAQKPSVQGYGKEHQTFDVSLDVLSDAAQKLNVSRHSIISAGFGLLLSAYSGSSDTIFGTVTSGRSQPIEGIDQIVGPCLATVPLRTDVSATRTIKDLITLHHLLLRQILRYGVLPLHKIQELSGICGRGTLFDTILVWQETSAQTKAEESVLSTGDTTDYLDYVLVLEVEPDNDLLRAKATFHCSVLPETQVRLFLSQLNEVTTLFAKSWDTEVDKVYQSLPVALLSIENSTFSNASHEKKLPHGHCDESIGRKASAHEPSDLRLAEDAWPIYLREPDRTAIEFAQDFDVESNQIQSIKVTFQELHDQSMKVAHTLATEGVRPGELVGIYMHKCAELYIFILGVLKAGAGYLPLDLRTPPDRARKVLTEASVNFLITANFSLKLFEDSTIKTCPLFNHSILKVNHPSEGTLLQKVDGSNVAYAISTSGTTGTPKTILVTRTNIVSNLAVLSDIYPYSPASRLLQSCSHAFDVSVFDILFSFRNGLRICSAPNDVLFRDLEAFIRNMHVTHLSMTSSIASLIDPNKVPSVKFLITAGEAVSSKVHSLWANKGLFQGYGPSETTNICSMRPSVTSNDFQNNIGFPFPNTSMFISAAEKFLPLPRGSVGEIYVGGEQLCNGYLKRPDLMSKFIVHPKWGRIYRTGDIGRVLSDGSFCIYGRQDDQIKLRGQRIELGEIDHVVLRLGGVSDCVTTIIESPKAGSINLVTFWTTTALPSDASRTSEMLNLLSTMLPSHMVPDDLILLDRIPVTDQGKSDKRALRDVYCETLTNGEGRSPTHEADTESFSDVHKTLAELVVEVTGISSSRIGRTTSFFRIGLNSISSILLSAKIRSRLHCQIDVSALFQHNTLDALATVVQEKMQTAPNMNSFSDGKIPSSLSIEGDAKSSNACSLGQDIFGMDFSNAVRAQYMDYGLRVDQILPCTPLQESMISNSLGPDRRAYWNQIMLEISTEQNLIIAAWEAALRRHEILRTGFVATRHPSFAFAQVILCEYNLPLTYLDSNQDNSVASSFHDDYIMPPYQLSIQTKPASDSIQLVLDIHHALYDAEAMSILLHDVQAIICGRTQVKPTPFQNYVRYMIGTDTEKEDAFWERQLHGFNYSPFLPQSGASKKGSSMTEQKHLQRKLDLSLDSVDETAKVHEATRSIVCQVAWARLIAIRNNAFDVCFGCVFSGRSLPIDGASNIVGPCFNTLPVHVSMKRQITNSELALNLRKINSAILPMQPSSLRRIQSKHGNGQEMFDTLLLIQHDTPPLDPAIWSVVSDTGDMAFPLICELVPDGNENSLKMALHWDESRMTDSDADSILTCYEVLLRDTCGFPASQAQDSTILGIAIPSFFYQTNTRSDAHSLGPDSISQEVEEDSQWGEAEKTIRAIAAPLAKVDPKSIPKSGTIFGLGLDSINAFQIANELRKEGYTISAGEILEAASIENIGRAVRQTTSSADQDAMFDFASFERDHLQQVLVSLSIENDTIQALRPCTAVQNGIIVQFLESHGALYLNQSIFEMGPDTDLQQVKRAWTTVAAAHDMLRTGFVQLESSRHPFAMLVFKDSHFQLPWSVSSELPDSAELGMETCESMQFPPWRLNVSVSPQKTLLRLSMMHAAYDAAAMNTILSDVATSYKNYQISNDINLLPTVSALLQAETHMDDNAQRFWREYAPDLQPTKFPDLRLNTRNEPGFDTVRKSCSLSYETLTNAARHLSTSIQVIVQMAWARLLSCLVGESHVTFGVVLSGRKAEVIGGPAVVFPCMNTLPLGVNVNQKKSDLLRTLSMRTASLVRHQNTPLTKVKKFAQFEGDLFDTIFVYQKPFYTATEADNLWKCVSEQSSAEYSVSIECIPCEDKLVKLQLTFMKSILPLEQAEIMLDQLDDLLVDSIQSTEKEALDFNGLPSRLCSILPAKEPRIESQISFLHEFVELSATKFPERVALEYASSLNSEKADRISWLYKELNEEGNAVAHLLLRRGVTQGSLVGVCFDKCPEASFAILGILKAGCAFVPIDPAAPLSRKEFMFEDAGCAALLTVTSQAEELTRFPSERVICLDNLHDLADLPRSPPALCRTILKDDLCYCLFTSGSTGTPKGCEITHDNAVQAMMAFQRLFAGHWKSSSRWLQFASFHFDVSVLEQYWSWSVGICVVSAPRDLLLEDIAAAIRSLQITHIDLTPSLARLLKPRDVPSLSEGVFITGGEQLRQEIIDIWGNERVIYNGYGPTEVTIGCTMFPRVPRFAKPSNIGPQFYNVGSLVLQPGTRNIIPRGCVGELCIFGPLVGKGYHNRPRLTRERFQNLEQYGHRVYRTGDLVRLLYDGSFEFLGRLDDQVKLRGQRLEIGEINHVILGATRDNYEVFTSIFKHSERISDQLVSFLGVGRAQSSVEDPILVTDESCHDLKQTVHNVCKERLPGYMVPSVVLVVDHLPLSANNKIDQRKLKRWYERLPTKNISQASYTTHDFRQNTSPIIAKIVEALESVLDRTECHSITPSSSFFELGLDSISAITFARALKRQGFDVRPMTVMKYTTAASLASNLQSDLIESDKARNLQHAAEQKILAFRHQHLPSVAQELGRPVGNIEGIAPCTPLQEAIIFKSLETKGALYFSLFMFQLSDAVDIEQLESAWSEVQSKNDILRTYFIATEDGYAQAVLTDNESFRMSTLKNDSDRDLIALIGDDYRRWRDGVRELNGRLWNVWVAKSDRRHVMCLGIFHALYDGISLSILLEDVAREYYGQPSGHVRPSFQDILPKGPLSQPDGAKDFWMGTVDFPRPLGLPVDNTASSRTLTYSKKLSLSEVVGSMRSSIGVTEPAIFQACWLLALQKIFTFLPLIGVVVSGRTFEGANEVSGPMFNTIPLQINVGGNTSLSALIRKCHDFNVSSMPFQHTSLRDLIKWTRRPSSELLPDSLFVFQKERPEGEVCEQLWSPLESESNTEYPLAVEVQQNRDSTFSIMIVGKENVFSADQLQQFGTHMEQCLKAAAETPLNDIPKTIVGKFSDKSPKKSDMISQDSTAVDFKWTIHSQKLREIIASLAGVDADEVQPHTSILTLGLDSIDAMKLSARLKSAGLPIPVSEIMRCQEIEAIWTAISSHPDDRNLPKEVPDVRAQRRQLDQSLRNQGLDMKACELILPVTSSQEGMIAQMLSSGFEEYYNHDVLELLPGIEWDRVCKAWERVIQQNPILRTKFIAVEDLECPISFAQVVTAPTVLEWEPVIIRQESELQDVINSVKNEAKRSGLGGAMLGLTPVRCKSKSLLVVTAAHAIFDGWSMDLIFEDVAKYYDGQPPFIRPSYVDFVEQILQANNPQNSNFWASQLSGVSATLVEPSESSNIDSLQRDELQSVYPASRVLEFCRLQSVTPQTLGICCWSIVLGWIAKQLDVCFGMVLAGRTMDSSEDVIFPMMNTVLFRAILHGTRVEMLRYLQEISSKVNESQHFPVREAMKLAGRHSGSLFNTLFVYQKRPFENGRSRELYRSVGGSSDTQFPLNVEMEVAEDRVIWRLARHHNTPAQGRSNRILEQIQEVLAAIIEDPNESVYVEFGSQVSLCGLPPFILVALASKDDQEDLSEDRAAVANSSKEWTTLEAALRTALSTFASVSEEEIAKHTSIFNLGIDSISAIKLSAALRKQSLSLSVTDILKAATVERMAQTIQSSSDLEDLQSIVARSGDLLRGVDTKAILSQHDIHTDDIKDILPATAFQLYASIRCQQSDGQLFNSVFTFKVGRGLPPPMIDSSWKYLAREYPILRTILMPTGFVDNPLMQIVLKPGMESKVRWSRDVTEQSQDDLEPRVALFVEETPTAHIFRLKINHALYDAISVELIRSTFEDLLFNRKRQLPTHTDFGEYLRATRSTDPEYKNHQESFWKEYLGTREIHPSRDLSGRSDLEFAPKRTESFRAGLFTDFSGIDKIARENGLSGQEIFTAVLGHIINATDTSGESKLPDDGIILGFYLANRHLDLDGVDDLAAPTVNVVPIKINPHQTILKTAEQIHNDLADIRKWEHCGLPEPLMGNESNGHHLEIPDGEMEAAGPCRGVVGALDQSVTEAILPTLDVEVRKLKYHEQKLLKKVDLISYKSDGPSHREHAVRRRYHLSKDLDYSKYNTLCGSLRQLAHKLADLDPSDPYRIRTETALLEKLFSIGILKQSRSQGAGLSNVEKDVTVSAFARRRLGVVMVRIGMVENVQAAVKFIEQQHVRVGTDVVDDPAFLVTRNMEDFVTWVDSSKVKRNVLKYREKLDDFDLL
ncbi:MAG: hypothetical protein Q9227_006277 [Pyrenula ochraceoflavens]